MSASILPGGLSAFAAALPFSIAIATLLFFPLLALWFAGLAGPFARYRPTWGFTETTFVIFLILSLISAAAGINPRHSFYQVYKKDFYFLIFILSAAVLRESRWRTRALGWFVLAGVITAVFGLIQYAIGISQIDPHQPSILYAPVAIRNWPPKLLALLGTVNGRAVGTRSHPLTYAEGLLFILSVCMARIIFSGTQELRRWIPAAWIVCGGLLVSQSRGPWLAAACAVAVAWWPVPGGSSIRRLLFMLLPAVGLLVLAPLRERAGTIGNKNYHSNIERIHMWQAGRMMWSSHRLLGIGAGNVIEASPPYQTAEERAEGPWGHLHSTYVNFAAERGILGLFAFLMLIGAMTVELLSGLGRRSPMETRVLTWAALLSILQFLISGLTETNYSSGVIMMQLYFVVGVALAAVRSQRGALAPQAGAAS